MPSGPGDVVAAAQGQDGKGGGCAGQSLDGIVLAAITPGHQEPLDTFFGGAASLFGQVVGAPRNHHLGAGLVRQLTETARVPRGPATATAGV